MEIKTIELLQDFSRYYKVTIGDDGTQHFTNHDGNTISVSDIRNFVTGFIAVFGENNFTELRAELTINDVFIGIVIAKYFFGIVDELTEGELFSKLINEIKDHDGRLNYTRRLAEKVAFITEKDETDIRPYADMYIAYNVKRIMEFMGIIKK